MILNYPKGSERPSDFTKKTKQISSGLILWMKMDKETTPMDYFLTYNFNAQVTEEDGSITKQCIKYNVFNTLSVLIDSQFYSWFEAVYHSGIEQMNW